MRTVSCPLCGLRYASQPELDLHAREDHGRKPEPERQESIPVRRRGGRPQDARGQSR